ncbi:MAG: Na+/H+ antiporter subunit D [Bacteroidetes bacterium]|jgi:multicomponent Na+:H+ antiporter subunit D|nr:Na+/H+ antiporter subunit D [Bacteroidota bacterium]
MIYYELILPILLPLLTGIILVAFWGKVNIQRIISVISGLLSLIFSVLLFITVQRDGIITIQAGNWDAPFGITFVADTLSSVLVLLTSISGLAVIVFSTVSINKARMRFGYFAMVHFLLLGLNGAFLTGDIFNLYVWFEVIIISSFVLLTIGGEKKQLEGAINYVTMNLLSSVIFLTAVAILYGLAGTLNMADLSEKIAEHPNRGLVQTTAILFFVAFGIKSAVFPLYFWLPSAYHTPPSAVGAIFGGLLTKVGIYALLRTFSLIFIPDSFLSNVLIIVASLTLLTGGLGAIAQQNNFRKLISYLIVCHIGFMIAGIGMYTEWALIGAVFYLIHDMVIKTNIFLISGVILKIKGTVNLKKLGGLYREFPKLSFLMAIAIFSLVGIPPLSGFWPKIFLFQESLSTREYALTVFLIFGSFITLYIMARAWIEIFWKEGEGRQAMGRPFIYFENMRLLKKWVLITPIVFLTLISVYIGLGAEQVLQISQDIVSELKNSESYIQAVIPTK